MSETPEDETIQGVPVLKPAKANPKPSPVLGRTVADDLDAAYAEIRREPYFFTWSGREWSLPHIGDLDYRVLAEIESMDAIDTEQVLSLFSRMFTADQVAAWAEVQVPTPVLFMLFERWVAHGGGKLGEAPASSGSSGSIGKSSRRTSGSSTVSASRKSSSAKPKKAAAKRTPRKAAAAPAVVELADSPPGSSST